jgi:halocyanin-like protein
MEQSRRAFLGGLGAVGIAGLAGCGGRTRATPAGTPRPTVGTDATFDGYLAPTANYDDTVADARDETEPTILVGAAGNGGSRAYEPSAIAVSPGTTVVWEWTGAGGAHNVVSESGAFESALVTDANHTFTHTFDADGVYKYYCTPHLRSGMKGVVAVGDVL